MSKLMLLASVLLVAACGETPFPPSGPTYPYPCADYAPVSLLPNIAVGTYLPADFGDPRFPVEKLVVDGDQVRITFRGHREVRYRHTGTEVVPPP